MADIFLLLAFFNMFTFNPYFLSLKMSYGIIYIEGSENQSDL